MQAVDQSGLFGHALPIFKGLLNMNLYMRRSDPLFLATGFFGVEEGADGMNGCDCNHRGGAPGFAKVLSRLSLVHAHQKHDFHCWTAGHPRITMFLCSAIIRSDSIITTNMIRPRLSSFCEHSSMPLQGQLALLLGPIPEVGAV